MSSWRLELDPDCNGFDLATVSDVVFRIQYTARDGGDVLFKASKLTIHKLDVVGVPKPEASPERLPELTSPKPPTLRRRSSCSTIS